MLKLPEHIEPRQGAVWRGAWDWIEVWNRRLQRAETWRVLHRDLRQQHVARTRARREARVLSKVIHPAVARFYELGEVEGRLYIATEPVTGEPLDAQMRSRKAPYSLAESVSIVQQLVEAIACAHREGVLHRNIAPENVLLIGDTVKIIDFGLASLRSAPETFQISVATTPIGSFNFAAPEMFQQGAVVDRRTDLYSVGCLFFFLLTGRPPFDADGVREIIEAHTSALPARPTLLRPELPSLVDDVILRCLEKSPDRRYQSAEELVAAIKALQASTRSSTAEMAPILFDVSDEIRPPSVPDRHLVLGEMAEELLRLGIGVHELAPIFTAMRVAECELRRLAAVIERLRLVIDSLEFEERAQEGGLGLLLRSLEQATPSDGAARVVLDQQRAHGAALIHAVRRDVAESVVEYRRGLDEARAGWRQAHLQYETAIRRLEVLVVPLSDAVRGTSSIVSSLVDELHARNEGVVANQVVMELSGRIRLK